MRINFWIVSNKMLDCIKYMIRVNRCSHEVLSPMNFENRCSHVVSSAPTLAFALQTYDLGTPCLPTPDFPHLVVINDPPSLSIIGLIQWYLYPHPLFYSISYSDFWIQTSNILVAISQLHSPHFFVYGNFHIHAKYRFVAMLEESLNFVSYYEDLVLSDLWCWSILMSIILHPHRLLLYR